MIWYLVFSVWCFKTFVKGWINYQTLDEFGFFEIIELSSADKNHKQPDNHEHQSQPA